MVFFDTPCLTCRAPLLSAADGYFCYYCQGYLQDWLVRLFYNPSAKSQTSFRHYVRGPHERNKFSAWIKLRQGIIRLFQIRLHKPTNTDLVPLEITAKWHWRGFYAGDRHWKHLKLDRAHVHLADTEWASAHALIRELKNNNLLLLCDVQC